MTSVWERWRSRGNGSSGPSFALRDLADRTMVRESEQRRDEAQRQIVDAIPIPMTITSRATGRFFYINRPTTEIFGLRYEQIGSINVSECYADVEDRQRFVDQLSREGKVTAFECRLRRVDGTTFWGLLNSSALSYQGEEAILTAIAVIDRRKQLEEQLQKAEREYRVIFENAVEGIFQTTPDGRYLRANPALARIYGYETVDALMAGMTDIGRSLYAEPRRRDEFVAEIERRGKVKRFESQVRKHDGSTIWISENARAVRDEAGRIVYYEGTVEDITARKALEDRLQEGEALLRNMIDTAPVAVAIIGRGGRP